jgi:hypothetical protein
MEEMLARVIENGNWGADLAARCATPGRTKV